MNTSIIDGHNLIQFYQVKQNQQEYQKNVRSFMVAAAEGDTKSLKRFLDSKKIYNINVKDPTTSQTALETAALKEHKCAVLFLIENGARFEEVSDANLKNVYAMYLTSQVKLDLMAKNIASVALLQVMDFLSPKEVIAKFGLACKTWNRLINTADQRYWKERYRRLGGDVEFEMKRQLEIPKNFFQKLCLYSPLGRLPSMAFGKEMWMKFLNVDVGIEPPMPGCIESILNEPCPFWIGKTVRQTHTLVLVPETVLVPGAQNRQPLTLKLFGELVKKFFSESENGIGQIGKVYLRTFANITSGRSRWVLMTNDIIPNSCYLDYQPQQKLVSDAKRKIPSFIDVVVSNVMDYISKKGITKLNRHQFIRCTEISSGSGCMVFQGLSPQGLNFYEDSGVEFDNPGVTGSLEF